MVPSWLTAAGLRRATIISLIVGTILTLINQGDLMASGAAPVLWKCVLTYMVPFMVSFVSTVLAQRDCSRRIAMVRRGHDGRRDLAATVPSS